MSRPITHLVTLRIPETFVYRTVPMDSTLRQELSMLLLSYTSKSAKFDHIRHSEFLCLRCRTLMLHAADRYIRQVIERESTLSIYLWMKNRGILECSPHAGGGKLAFKLRAEFLKCLLDGRTEFTLALPRELLTEDYLHAHE